MRKQSGSQDIIWAAMGSSLVRHTRRTAAKGLEGRVSGTDGITRSDNRRDGMPRVYAEGPISARNCRLCCGVALLSLCAPQMEDAMCYAKDYKIFDDQKKAEDTRVVQERRAGLIDRLLNAANKHGEKTKAEETTVKEVAPAK